MKEIEKDTVTLTGNFPPGLLAPRGSIYVPLTIKLGMNLKGQMAVLAVYPTSLPSFEDVKPHLNDAHKAEIESLGE